MSNGRWLCRAMGTEERPWCKANAVAEGLSCQTCSPPFAKSGAASKTFPCHLKNGYLLPLNLFFKFIYLFTLPPHTHTYTQTEAERVTSLYKAKTSVALRLMAPISMCFMVKVQPARHCFLPGTELGLGKLWAAPKKLAAAQQGRPCDTFSLDCEKCGVLYSWLWHLALFPTRKERC